ncbi:MAG TPA: ABC transporter ATP-binding protein [Fimbriimonadaceae bacterium]|nr:ABC transporter ATP-binding protein [Fimbriimonadaceae bacterium]
MSSAKPVLECHGLRCGYPERVVLGDLDLSIGPGEIVALLGPNGSGKSTLLKSLGREIPLLGGEVRLGDVALGGLSYGELARRLAYVPQEEIPVFSFSVRDIVLMGRLAHSDGLFESREDRAAAEAAMVAADCQELAARPVTEISGGERQRVLLARALAQETPLILLDEPTAHLDVGHQLAFAELLRGLASAGTAMLAAVHDLNFASALATRGIVLSGGQAIADGPIREVLASAAIDEAYGVVFERVVTASGDLRVFAVNAPSSARS